MGPGLFGLPMQGGTLQNIPPNAGREEQINALNDVINRLNNMLKAQTFSDGTSKRYVQGYAKGRWPGGDFGVAISKPGEDVTQVEFANLLFAWDFSTNKQYFNGGTQIFYDPETGKDVGQVGILPNGKGGNAWAKENESVDDAFAGS